MRVGIVAQKGNAHAAYLAADVRETLTETGVAVVVDEATADALDVTGTAIEQFADCDLVVSIGGDGTFLYAAHGADTVPVLGVNLGEVGFLNAVAPGEAIDAVRAEVRRFRETGAVRSTTVPRLQARGDAGWSLAPALNEVVVQGPQRGHGHGLSVEVRIDGDLYVASHADGLLVATPTGSTAYNLSEGGPLVQPGVAGFVVSPMAPVDAMPPLLVRQDAVITIRADDAPHAFVVSDGRDRVRVETPDVVHLGAAPEPARVAGPGLEFFGALGKLE